MKTFHLAIPVESIPEAVRFYVALGGSAGRKYPSHQVINFFGHQLVVHLSPHAIDKKPKMYPRHFGIVFKTLAELHALVAKAKDSWVFEPLFIRRYGMPEEHHTFFLKDPSNNLIEFKWYKNAKYLF